MPRRTKDEAEKTREAILKAAEAQFYENGVVSTSLQEVAKEAGVTRGAVYWHFRDKADILRALMDRAYLPHEALLDRLVAEDLEDPIASLYVQSCSSLNAVVNDPQRRRLLTILARRCEYIQEMKSLLERNELCRTRLFTRLTSILGQAQRKKKMSGKWTPQTAALVLQNMITGFVFNEMEYEKPSRSRDKARNEALAVFFESLKA